MKKRLLATLLALIMMVGLLPTAVFAADSDFVIEYGVLKKYTGPGGDVVIPNGVTGIGGYAFSGWSGLTSVTIPDSVSKIENGTFDGCTGLTSVTMGNGVTSIGERAFRYCTSLTSVTIPNGVTIIGNSAFQGCTGLTSVTIPSSVTSIGDQAFEGCTGLTAVTIPDGVTSIGYDAFYGCTSLTSVTIPNSVTSIGWCVFRGCTNLTSVTIPDSVTSIGDQAFQGCTGLTAVTIPNSVTSIGQYAFSGCKSLTSVTIPNSVSSIGKYAFSGCTGLTAVTIPDGVTSIGKYAFSECKSLTSVTIPDSVTKIGEGAFYGCTGLTSVTIPSGVTSIEGGAFQGCTGLTSIEVAEGNQTFASQDGVLFNKEKTQLIQYPKGKTGAYTIPDSVTSIGDGAFKRCTSLTSVIIPNSVTVIGGYAFQDCTSLTGVTIPDSVTSIGEWLFSGCTNLTDVYYGGTEAQWQEKGVGHCFGSGVAVHYAGGAGAYPLKEVMFSVNTDAENYTGKPITKKIFGWDKAAMTEGTDYTVAYANNVEPGKATVTITGIGGYTGTLTYTFTIKENNFKVTTRLDGGVGPDAFVLNPDGTLQKPADPTKPGFVFAGWYLDNGTAWDFSKKATGDMTLTARWLPAAKIILRLDTGDISVDTAKGQPMNVPTNPTKAGYTFGGWFTDEALTIPWNFNTTVTGDMSLYGKWTPLTSTATDTGRSSQTITFNGAPIQLEAYTLAADSNGGDVTFVKLRDVAQVLDNSRAQFNVDWKNGAIYVVTNAPYTTKNGGELQPIVVNTTDYKQNTNPVLFDGELKSLESIIITDVNGGGHTFFKLRDLAAAIGFTVGWTPERGIYMETK